MQRTSPASRTWSSVGSASPYSSTERSGTATLITTGGSPVPSGTRRSRETANGMSESIASWQPTVGPFCASGTSRSSATPKLAPTECRRPYRTHVRILSAARNSFPAVETYALIDLFAGCGGMTLGFERTRRFKSIFAVEYDQAAAETYRRNFGDHVAAQPIEHVRDFPRADVLIGGPPCQGFSPLNMLGVGLDRRLLWREYLRALKQAAPVAFVMENVPELLRSAEYAPFVKAARKLEYDVEGKILNPADYGVPQRRRRAIVTGSRAGRPTWPEATHCPPEDISGGALPWRSFREAVEGLPLKPDGRNWHNSRNPRPMSLERYRTIPADGEGRVEHAERRADITPAYSLLTIAAH